MAQETSNLILRVDSTSVQPAAKSLDDLTRAAERTEKATDSLAQATAESNQRYKDVARAALERKAALDAEVRAQYESATSTKRVTTEMQAQARAYTATASAELRARQAAEASAASMAKAAQAAAAERAELSSLLGAIDPVTRALDRLDQQQQQLRRAQARGLIDADTFNTYNTKLNQTREQLGRFDDGVRKAGMTAKQSAQAMRMLPAQLTDITVGLLTGQPPLMVFLQQGGQLKDMFGGIGPAARAVGGAILGLVNPLTVAAAAVAALTVAYYQGSNESSKFNAALALTGDYAGRTAQQLGDMARTVGESVNSTTGRAAAALTALVETGRVAGSSLEGVATAVVNMNEASGRAIDSLVKDFTRLGDEPTRAIAELNKSMHFLDLATYERIRALESQGQKEQAAALAQSTYAAAVNQAADRVRASAGTLERGWNTLGLAARKAWDYMLNIGRPTPVEELRKQATALRATLDDLDKNGGFATTGGGAAVGGGGNAAIRARQKAAAELAAIEEQITAQEKEGAAARSASLVAQEAERTQQASDRMEALRKETRTRKQIRDDEIAQVRRDGETLRWTTEQVNKAIAAVEEKYKDPKGRTGGNRVSEAARLLEAARQQGAVLEQQADSAQKITTARATLIKFEQLITDLKDGRQLNADQKSVLLAEQQLRAQYEKNAALEDENRARQESLRLTSAQQAADQALANDRARYADQLVGIGGSSRDRERMQAQQQMVRENQRQIDQLERDYRLGRISEAARDGETAILRQNLDARLEANREYYAQLAAVEGNWLVGAQSALAEYSLAARDAAGMAKGFFTSAFQGLETVLTDFITTGKASFKDFVSSLLAEASRLIARQGIIQPLLGFVGSFLPALGPAAPAAGSGVTMPTGGIRLPGRARGGPVRAGSMYEVNENGPELLTSGGRTFLMMGGEGGHVTPGVAGAAGAGAVNINVGISNVFEGSGGAASTQTTGTGQNPLVDQLSTMMEQQMRALLQKETYQQGGIIWNLRNGNANR